jgi:hypothetical protein
MSPDHVIGLGVIMPDAIAMKYIAAPLTEAQLRELIQFRSSDSFRTWSWPELFWPSRSERSCPSHGACNRI